MTPITGSRANQATSKAFRSINTLEKWAEVSRQVRTPLGAMQSRALVAVDFAPTPQGYWLVKFRTDYANKPGVIETLSLVNEDGSWKVTGITIEWPWPRCPASAAIFLQQQFMAQAGQRNRKAAGGAPKIFAAEIYNCKQ